MRAVRPAAPPTAAGRCWWSGVDRPGRPPHQPGLAVGRLVLVDDSLGRRLVDALDGEPERLLGIVCIHLRGLHGLLGAGAQLGLDRLVASLPLERLAVALDLATD